MNEGVYVVGASGHAKVAIATARAAGFQVLGALDDDVTKQGTSLMGVKVVGPVAALPGLSPARAIIAIGDNRIRRVMADAHPQVEWVTIVHPGAILHESVSLGPGTVVFAGAVLQPDVVVGRHAIVNTAASVDHDGRLADFAQVAPGVHLGGNVVLDEGAMIGLGASVIQGIHIGAWSLVGAGAVVVRDLPDHVKALGVPARVVSRTGESGSGGGNR